MTAPSVREALRVLYSAVKTYQFTPEDTAEKAISACDLDDAMDAAKAVLAASGAAEMGSFEWYQTNGQRITNDPTPAEASRKETLDRLCATPPASTPSAARERIAERIVEFARDGYQSIRLTRDVGPYEITEPTPAALEFADSILALVPDEAAVRQSALCVISYTNYRGETSVRRIIPKSVRFGSTEWHPEPQWLLLAWDDDKQVDREFALKDFGSPEAAIRAATFEEAAKIADKYSVGNDDEFDDADMGGVIVARQIAAALRDAGRRG